MKREIVINLGPAIDFFERKWRFILAIAVLILLLPFPHFSRVVSDNRTFYGVWFGRPIALQVFSLPSSPEKSPPLKMEVFIMSYCPFGRRFVLNTLPQILDTYPQIDWHVYYIVNKQGNKFTSMHGDTELQEDMREACIWEKYGREKWLDFVLCFYSKNNFADCAKEVGIDGQEIERCKNEEGTKLLEDDYKRSQELRAFASPTIVFNNGEERIEGARPFQDFNSTIYQLLTGEELPNPPIKLFIIVPKDCPKSFCDYSGIVGALRNNLGLNLTTEVKDPAETDLDEKFSLRSFPAYIFDSSIRNSPAFSQLAPYITQNGNYFLLRTRGGVINAEEKPRRLDLFVMSHCPFGNKAEEVIREVMEVLPWLEVHLWFIADENNGKFSSMHGEEEVNEDMRQVCIAHHYPEKLWDYLACINPVYSQSATKWKECAREAGVDVTKIEECWKGDEGKRLFSQNIRKANELGFGGSPTFLINGRYVLGGLRSAEEVKRAICSVNPGMEGCEKTLNSTAGVPGGTCG